MNALEISYPSQKSNCTTSNFAKVRFKLYSRLQTAVQWCNVVRAVRHCAIPLYLMLPRITICITISDDNADHGTAVTRHPHVYHVYPAHVCMLYPGCHCICIIPNVNVSVSSYKSSLSDKPPHQPSYRTVVQQLDHKVSCATIHTFTFDTRT